ncbi:MAG: hypothetical protein WKG06_32690 [Segetibacter sp.]
MTFQRWYLSGLACRHFGAILVALHLSCSGIAITVQNLLKPVALLLALMLFLWFVSLHVPNAIANPYAGRGNRIVSAFDALLFCGVALVLSQSKKQSINKVSENVWAGDARKRSGIEI